MWTASVLERISTKFVHLKSLLELGLEHRAIRNSTPHGTEPTVISVQAHSEPTAELDCVTHAQPSGDGTQSGDIGGGVGEVVSLKSNSSCNPCFDEPKADSAPELTNRSLARGLACPSRNGTKPTLVECANTHFDQRADLPPGLKGGNLRKRAPGGYPSIGGSPNGVYLYVRALYPVCLG